VTLIELIVHISGIEDGKRTVTEETVDMVAVLRRVPENAGLIAGARELRRQTELVAHESTIATLSGCCSSGWDTRIGGAE
jgi:hypothetical protein